LPDTSNPIEAGAGSRPPVPEGYHTVTLEDADAAHRRAIEAGATSVTEVTHLYWGDRVGRVRDPLGNFWWLQTRVEKVDDAEMERRLGEKVWIERMEYVQGSLAFPPEPRT
jgi:PhnB protein